MERRRRKITVREVVEALLHLSLSCIYILDTLGFLEGVL